jgi:hypothetical protein
LRLVPNDLEDELLRAAVAQCDRDAVDTLVMQHLRDFIAAESARFPRLANPLLADLVDALIDRLVHDGLLARSDGGYVLTERARAHLRREPDVLRR